VFWSRGLGIGFRLRRWLSPNLRQGHERGLEGGDVNHLGGRWRAELACGFEETQQPVRSECGLATRCEPVCRRAGPDGRRSVGADSTGARLRLPIADRSRCHIVVSLWKPLRGSHLRFAGISLTDAGVGKRRGNACRCFSIRRQVESQRGKRRHSLVTGARQQVNQVLLVGLAERDPVQQSLPGAGA
jgi:hypothetical protein